MVKKDARRFFKRARGSHDWDHTERVLRLCLRIGKKEKADLRLLKLAALLHDIGRTEEDRSRMDVMMTISPNILFYCRKRRVTVKIIF